MININPDTLRERIRERLDESEWQLCPNCESGLTADDLEEGECSNCDTALDVNDESVDEDFME